MLVGTQLDASLHAPQVPLLQYMSVPHMVPSRTFPCAVHTGFPVSHAMAICWHEPVGVQSAPLLHGEHVPELQTPVTEPDVQLVPFCAEPVAVHTRLPPASQVY